MNKKKLIGYVFTGVLSVGIVGGMGISSFATTAQEKDVGQQSSKLTDKSPPEKIQMIMDELNSLGITLPNDKGDTDVYLANLDANSKEKIEEIAGKIKTKKLTSEEAKELRKQRINLPKQEKNTDKFANIDEETREKAKEILGKVVAGTVTKDEAIGELRKLGITSPNLEQIPEPFAHLDGETKAKAEAIYKKLKEGTITKEEAAIEIRKLRISHR